MISSICSAISEFPRLSNILNINGNAALALVKGLVLPNDIVFQTIIKLEKSPQESTSSMHRDLLAGHKTEVHSLTEFVVKEGLKYAVPTPMYKIILAKLLNCN